MNRPNPRAATFGQPISNPVMMRRYARASVRSYLRHQKPIRVQREAVRITIAVDTRQFLAQLRAAAARVREIAAAIDGLKALTANAADAMNDLTKELR